LAGEAIRGVHVFFKIDGLLSVSQYLSPFLMGVMIMFRLRLDALGLRPYGMFSLV
jgi:hypothetical protein